MRYAWVELNSDGKTELDNVIEGCIAYHNLGLQVIVTTVPGHEYLYNKLPDYVIGGLKTAGILKDFNEASQWEELAHYIDRIPSDQVVFEHETALMDYWFGRNVMQQSKLKAGLKYLNPDRHYIWYPHFHSDGEWVVSHNLQKYMTKTIQAVLPHVEFTDSQFIYPENHYWDSEIQGIRDSLARDPTMHIWYPKASWPHGWEWKNWYKLIDTMEAEKKNKDWIFYPGATNWVSQVVDLKKALELTPSAANKPVYNI